MAAPAEAASPAAALQTGNPWELYRQGDFKSAQHNFDTRLAEGGADPDLAFGKGASAFKNKDYDTAIDAFGSAVLTKDLKLRSQSHYNLANAIYERAAATAAKAKPATWSKLTFIDGLIRQLENSLENYQQSLVLDPGNADTQANHDTTDELIQKLRKIRKVLAQQQGEGKQDGQKKKGGKKKGPGDQGQGSPGGDGEGSEQSGKSGPNGENRGKGNRKPGEEGENGEKEDEDGDGGKADREEKGEGTGREGETEKEAREKSNKDRQGDIGTADGNSDARKEDAEKGTTSSDEGPEDMTKADRFQSDEGGGDDASMLDQYSDEDTKVRPRIDSAPEPRPRKDW
jgi:tetratricopeptide (TPR) repeat protein